jgi:hypothetical protein
MKLYWVSIVDTAKDLVDGLQKADTTRKNGLNQNAFIMSLGGHIVKYCSS